MNGDPDSRRRPRASADGDRRALQVAVVDAHGRAVRGTGIARWLAAVAPRAAAGHVSVALVSDARIRALNRQYRSKDLPTDVLSFPSAPQPAGRHGRLARRPIPRDSSSGLFLGDIAIATGVARRQATRAGHSHRTELRILALHGLLHLIGYDHETDSGTMARVERRLRRRGGLREGLIERGAASHR
jgi:probable rRNA maturation factor